MRYTEKINETDYKLTKYNDIVRACARQKLGKLEDIEEQLGCPLEVLVKAFQKYVGLTTECDFGYDNIPDEYQKYKNDNKFKTLSYDSGLIYIAIQEALKEDKSE